MHPGPALFMPKAASSTANYGYLMQFDDPANPQVFPDVMPNTWARGAFIGANLTKLQVSNAQVKFGAGSLEMTTVGGSTDFTITGTPNGGTFTLLAGNRFTLAGWVWWTGHVDSRPSAGAVLSTAGAVIAEIRSFGVGTFAFRTALGTADTQAAAMTLNQWTHVEMGYDGTTKYWFINGILQGSAVVPSGSAAPITGYKIDGVPSGNAAAPAAYLDALSFEINTCRHTANFVPPTDPPPTPW